MIVTHTHREREREAETQAEAEAGSMHQEPDVGSIPGLQDRGLGKRHAPNHCATQGTPKSIFLLRVELTFRPSQFPTACRMSFAGLHQRSLPEASETQVNNADLEGISRCSRVVIWEPVSEYCYLHPAIRMQLVDSWLQGMLPCES